MSTPSLSMNARVLHCPLGIIKGSDRLHALEQCQYASVCPTPCTAEDRLNMQLEEESTKCPGK